MSTDDKKIRFNPDAGLMFLIQQVTKESSDQILGFFYDFGKEVLRIGIEKMSTNQRSIRKDIRDIYPGTAIPFKLFVEASRYQGGVSRAEIYVQFPDNPSYINTTEMLDLIMERQLLGGSAIPDFEQPKSKTPKMYKALIKNAIEGKHETICDTGHPRQTGSATETPSDTD